MLVQFLLLASISAAPPIGNLRLIVHPQITAQRQMQFPPGSFGPEGHIVNGEIVINAILAVAKVRQQAGGDEIVDAADAMLSTDESGDVFSIGGAKTRLTVNLTGPSPEPSAEIRPVLTMPVSFIDAIQAAYAMFLGQRLPSIVTDRDLRNYDVIVFANDGTRTGGRFAGTIAVSFLHHRVQAKTTVAGCSDGFGYNGEYFVNPSTLSVTPGNC